MTEACHSRVRGRHPGVGACGSAGSLGSIDDQPRGGDDQVRLAHLDVVVTAGVEGLRRLRLQAHDGGLRQRPAALDIGRGQTRGQRRGTPANGSVLLSTAIGRGRSGGACWSWPILAPMSMRSASGLSAVPVPSSRSR
jgi:hypothetical protein